MLAETIQGFLVHKRQSAVHLRDLPCGRGATDIEWINFLRNSGDEWLVFTGDLRIQRTKAERLAYRQARLRGFVLAPAYQDFAANQQASRILWRWADIESLLKLAPPFLFELPIKPGAGIRTLNV